MPDRETLSHQSARGLRLLDEGPAHGVCNKPSEVVGYGPTWVEYRCQQCGRLWRESRRAW